MPPKKATATPAPATTVAADAENKLKQQIYVRQSLQQQTASLKSRVRQQESDAFSLRRSAERASKETAEFIAYFQAEIEKKDSYISELRDKLRDLEFDSTAEVKKLKRRFEEERSRLEQNARATIQPLQTDVRKLRDELGRLQQFKLQKAEHDAKLEELREELEEERIARREEVAALERKFLLDKKKVTDEHSSQFGELKRQARIEAQRQLDVDTKRVILDNKRMSEELSFHQQQTAALTHEKQALIEQTKKFAREIGIYEDKETEYAKLGQQRTKTIRDLRAKVRALERALGQATREYDENSKTTYDISKRQISTLQEEVKDLKNTILRKDKELGLIRSLAEAIVRQRSDVEQFLIEALQDVRVEMTAQQRAIRQSQARSNISTMDTMSPKSSIRRQLPDIRSIVNANTGRAKHTRKTDATNNSLGENGTVQVTLQPSGSSKLQNASMSITSINYPRESNTSMDALSQMLQQSNRVDIKDLKWIEKEKILRVLFAKINSAESMRTESRRSQISQKKNQTEENENEFEAGGPFGLAVPLPANLTMTHSNEQEKEPSSSRSIQMIHSNASNRTNHGYNSPVYQESNSHISQIDLHENDSHPMTRTISQDVDTMLPDLA